ncbi:MAG: hypothetical protein ACLTX3_07450 [Lachnospiraceae bacterium]
MERWMLTDARVRKSFISKMRTMPRAKKRITSIPNGGRSLQKRLQILEQPHDKDGVRTYVFGYKTKLAPGETTSTLFDKIQIKNVIEDEILDNVANDIKVEAYAIQAEEVLDKAGADLTDDLSVTNMKTIYDIFVKQSTSYDEFKVSND